MFRYISFFLFYLASTLQATGTNDNQSMSLLWCLPFFGLLGSIAIFPVLCSNFWHNNYGKITLFWSILVLGLFYYNYPIAFVNHLVASTYLHEFIPFIIIASSLFIISGGIYIRFPFQGTPLNNTMFLAVGSLLASLIGTTGASMVLIRSFIHMNKNRENKKHIIIFFIFLICNLGGSLTAIGDPPLFLGFLYGIPFFWPLFHLLYPLIVVSVPLLIFFFCLDSYYYKLEGHMKKVTAKNIFVFQGKVNIMFLLLLICCVIISGYQFFPPIDFYGISLRIENLLRDFALLFLIFLSLIYTSKDIREHNGYSWFPLIEVIKLFAGIFIVAMPVIYILHQGEQGNLSFLLNLTKQGNHDYYSMYFWLTGSLSAFLDNAPTYLVFFHAAGGDSSIFLTTKTLTLTAISAGAVFFGALTYIGNAPNFFVKSIATEHKIVMPSFFGYMVWSCCFLLPLFYLVSYLLFP